ncbi:hypothetical protein BDR06DRAFT_891000 [Suillus hirtellus]|nr:hypothetical protein BDR06DRAFT_891000 [Suillus hirtellus]
MQKALEDFHQHKEVIINLGVRDDLDIPKFHSLQHYLENIKNFGTTDNYNTEMFERFHIDFCKEAWYASNGRNEKPQMIAWLTRREKVSSFQSYLKMSMEDEEEEFVHSRFGDQRLLLTKRPHQARRHILDVIQDHNCQGFKKDLISYLNSQLSDPHSRGRLRHMDLPFSHIDIYHGFKFCLDSLGNDNDFDQEETDTVKAKPSLGGKPARFDTVVVMDTSDCETTGLKGKFQDPLAYVEWYAPLKPAAEDYHEMYLVKKCLSNADGFTPGQVISLSSIRQTCQLIPNFGRTALPIEWTSDSVLDRCDTFFLNCFTSKYAYQTLW